MNNIFKSRSNSKDTLMNTWSDKYKLIPNSIQNNSESRQTKMQLPNVGYIYGKDQKLDIPSTKSSVFNSNVTSSIRRKRLDISPYK